MEVISIDQNANIQSSSCFDTMETIVSDLTKEYEKAKTIPEKIDIARAIKSCYDTTISATQVTINALNIVVKARVAAETYNLK